MTVYFFSWRLTKSLQRKLPRKNAFFYFFLSIKRGLLPLLIFIDFICTCFFFALAFSFSMPLFTTVIMLDYVLFTHKSNKHGSMMFCFSLLLTLACCVVVELTVVVLVCWISALVFFLFFFSFCVRWWLNVGRYHHSGTVYSRIRFLFYFSVILRVVSFNVFFLCFLWIKITEKICTFSLSLLSVSFFRRFKLILLMLAYFYR